VTDTPLTERLREHLARYGEVSLSAWASHAKHLIQEAAEAVALLEAAEAREKELEAKQRIDEQQCDEMTSRAGLYLERAEAAEARVAALTEALRDISEIGVEMGGEPYDWEQRIYDIARDVLAGAGGGEKCEHRDTSFSRTLCACGAMHDYCDDCGRALFCPLDEAGGEK